MLEKKKVKKQEVEGLLGYVLTDDEFLKALEYAGKKQRHIYKQEKRAVVLQRWYLVKLTEEYVRSLAFSKFTMDLCKMLNDMEKEHSANCQSAHTNNHIVALPAL